MSNKKKNNNIIVHYNEVDGLAIELFIRKKIRAGLCFDKKDINECGFYFVEPRGKGIIMEDVGFKKDLLLKIKEYLDELLKEEDKK